MWSTQPSFTSLQAFFPLRLQTSFSETLNHNDGSREPLAFSYLHFTLPSSFSHTGSCQRAKTDSQVPSTSCIILLHNLAECHHPHHQNGIHVFLHWDFQPMDSDHFSEAPTFSLSFLSVIKSSTHSLCSILLNLSSFLPNRICQTPFHKNCAFQCSYSFTCD